MSSKPTPATPAPKRSASSVDDLVARVHLSVKKPKPPTPPKDAVPPAPAPVPQVVVEDGVTIFKSGDYSIELEEILKLAGVEAITSLLPTPDLTVAFRATFIELLRRIADDNDETAKAYVQQVAMEINHETGEYELTPFGRQVLTHGNDAVDLVEDDRKPAADDNKNPAEDLKDDVADPSNAATPLDSVTPKKQPPRRTTMPRKLYRLACNPAQYTDLTAGKDYDRKKTGQYYEHEGFYEDCTSEIEERKSRHGQSNPWEDFQTFSNKLKHLIAHRRAAFRYLTMTTFARRMIMYMNTRHSGMTDDEANHFHKLILDYDVNRLKKENKKHPSVTWTLKEADENDSFCKESRFTVNP